MTDEEKQEWLESHKPNRGEDASSKGTSGENRRPSKPANLTDEEWEQKKAEIKAKLESMTDEEKQEWLQNHKPKGAGRSRRTTESADPEQTTSPEQTTPPEEATPPEQTGLPSEE